VDEADVLSVQEHKWHLYQGYVATELPPVDGKRKFIRLHRFLVNPPDRKLVVDHMDGNKLNNQRSNLRICTRSQNAQNQRKLRTTTTSPFRGVCRLQSGLYRATLQVEGTRVLQKEFVDEHEAARAYDHAARRFSGEYARLNFPRSGEQPALSRDIDAKEKQIQETPDSDEGRKRPLADDELDLAQEFETQSSPELQTPPRKRRLLKKRCLAQEELDLSLEHVSPVPIPAIVLMTATPAIILRSVGNE
jgi:hypothetical protein